MKFPLMSSPQIDMRYYVSSSARLPRSQGSSGTLTLLLTTGQAMPSSNGPVCGLSRQTRARDIFEKT
jgi:hypothetical protein